LGGYGKGLFTGALIERWDFVLTGDLVYWGIREICARRLWQRASLSIWAPLGNLEVGSFTGDAERQLNVGFGNGASLPMRAL